MRMCLFVCRQVMDELVRRASYYLLGRLLLPASFGSVGTDSSSHSIRRSLFAVSHPHSAAAAEQELNVAAALPELNK